MTDETTQSNELKLGDEAVEVSIGAESTGTESQETTPAADVATPEASVESADATDATATPVASETPANADDVSMELENPMRGPGMDWFVLRVASNKESHVRDTLLRKIQIEKLTHLVGRILVPTEKTKTIKGGKQRVVETKLYPGYVFVEMRLEDEGRIPQDVFFLIKETTGVGDFIGTAGRPSPMPDHEITKMLEDAKAPDEEPTIKMSFEKGEPVIIREGPFEGYEGSVDELLPEKGKVRVLVTIFGRQAPVEIEEWLLAKAEDM